jgi:hypothetical protein
MVKSADLETLRFTSIDGVTLLDFGLKKIEYTESSLSKANQASWLAEDGTYKRFW